MVMSTYLFLLTIQLILIFFKGMLKLTPSGSLNIPVSLFSVGLVILVSVISIKGKGIIGNFAILIGMIVGWIFYVWLFLVTIQLTLHRSIFRSFHGVSPNYK
ncbi:hypothetical protein AAAC51_33760 [Priestia megaterium]